MRTLLHTIAFSFKNILCKAVRNTPVWHSILKTGGSIVLFVLLVLMPEVVFGQAAASTIYATETGTLGTTYSWIDCSSGTTVVTGDDSRASFSWPFAFEFYDNSYTTGDNISVSTNGFIRLDGNASTDYTAASNYSLSGTSTELGQIIALAVYDCKVGDNGGWVKRRLDGTSPNRVLTIEFNNLEIGYNDNRYEDVQVSFYETTNKIVLKLGDGNVIASGVDMGIHSGVANYYYKWQEAAYGANNAWIEFTPTEIPLEQTGPAASWNYNTQTGTVETTYDWIDCSSGSTVVYGDDSQAEISWPFDFNFYDNSYTTADVLSVCTNGFIRLDGTASTDYSAVSSYNLTSDATSLGQIIALAAYDGNVGDNGGWVRSLVTGTAPNRIFTIEYNNLEIDYNDNKYADVQVSFYESTNKIVLKLGTDNINKSGVDMGLHSGVNTYFNDWQEVESGTNSTWIEYTPPNIEVNATFGSSIAFYPTLKDAFDKINNGTHQGEITIKINHSTTEPASAELNASGAGSANYSSVNIYPTKTGLSINGDLAAPLINLDGADNVTIDGRVNATGSTADLTIINSKVSGISNTSTIRFYKSATYNTIQYCTIKGGATGPYTAILLFAGTWLGSGNSNNRVENCNLTGLDASNRPYAVVYSYGTSGRENSNNSISNNNFYDFFNADDTSYGIYIYQYSSDWTIEGNSFYETTDFVPTGNAYYYAVRVSNTAGNNFSITNNYFGGQEALCAGDAFKMSTSLASRFYAIHLDVGTETPSSVQGNTIQNFDFSSSNSIIWMGIDANSGAVNIGTESGNTIGAATGNSSVLLTKSGSTLASKSYGIYVNSSGTVVISNNTIGSVTTTNSANLNPHSFYGIYKNGGKSGSLVVSHNLVGSETTSNSIQAATSCTSGSAQDVYGIMSSASGTTLISENTVANLFNAYAYQWADKGQVAGIYTNQGINTIQYNTVRNLSCTSPSASSVGNAAVIGIAQQSTAAGQTITGNTVYGLNSTYSDTRGVNVMGIYYYGGTSGTNSITNNFIHSLDASITNATLTGIKVYAGTTTIANNIINLGVGVTTGLTINGLYENGNAGNDNSVWFNAVYLGGTASGTTASTFALYSATNNNGRDFRNNILFNARTGGTTGKHYAIRIAGTSNLTIDYNDYFISGSPSVLGQTGSTDQATFTDWQTATSQDANSLNTDPIFSTPGGTNFEDYVTAAALPGIAITGITTDFDEEIRSNPPKMGALETSLSFVWQGDISTDFSDEDNWEGGVVPPDGADISFAATPANDCYLDQNRTLHEITNESAKKLVVNGKQLTIKGGILSATANQIDATAASSEVIFEGAAPQSIPSGGFVSNTINALTLNNEDGITQNGNIIVSTALTLTNGDYSIGGNTLTINGDITTNSGTLNGGGTSNVIIGGSDASTTLPGVVLNNLTLNRANGISLGGSVSVAGSLVLTAGTLTVGANTLTISGNAPTRTSGNIDAGNASATLVFTNTSTITLAASLFSGNINNLTINGEGITASSDLTINGVLNLQSANPSATKGSLDMTTYTLYMGADATTIGIGDVTGVIKRQHTFIGNIQYSFGNEYTTLTFINTGTKPGWVSCKVSIGLAPSWKSDAVKREYSFAKDAGTDNAIMNLHYLDAELDSGEPDETKLVIWDHHNLPTPDYVTEPHGKSNYDATNNWVGIGGMGIGYIAPSETHDNKLWGFAYSNLTKIIWTGLDSGNEGDWSSSGNWNGGVPTSENDVLIPAGLSTPYPNTNSNPGTVPALAKTIEIEDGASVTVDSYDITVSGSTGAWLNNGVFNAGTGKVIFNKGSAPYSYIVTIAGTTNFNTIEVTDNTYIQPTSGSIIRIGGVLTAGSGSILDFVATSNTIEYSGGAQNVLNPIGPGTDTGYYKLILSGSGTKTMPTSAMSIADEFKLTGSVTATAQEALTIGGELEIINGGTFITGEFNHVVGGHFDVGGHGGDDGTFTPSPGYSITLNGTDVQHIYGESEITFEDLVIDNSAGVDVSTDVTIDGDLTLTNGNLTIGETNLTINGGLVKTSGYIDVNSSSSLTFGGTTALTLPVSLFYTTPSVDSLIINRTGGVIMSSDFTVNGALILESTNPASGTIGTLDMGTYTLSMGENATTTGTGDVTGIVKREHTFAKNVPYSFGSQYTTFNFIDDNLKPTWISLKISIGSVASWSPWDPSPDGQVKRLYQIASSANSSTSAADINMRYLVSELHATENDESELVFWHKFTNYGGGLPHEHGPSIEDFTNHFLGVSGLILGAATSSDLDDSQVTIAYPVSVKNTWKGEVSGHETEWEQAGNWTAGHVPLSTEDVLIPEGRTYYPSLTATSNAVANTIEIHSGASISANSYNITVSGAGGAWINHGTFVPGTGTVIFDNALATISGTTNFYNVTINSGKSLRMEDHCVMRIAGAIVNNGDWHVVTTGNSTVEYNGGDQTVIAPNTTTRRYSDLILSGTGTKTMPDTTLNIEGDFTISGTATAVAADSIIVFGNTTIENGATFNQGSSTHLLQGNFENNGTFTAAPGGNIVFKSDSDQIISGSSITSFDNLTLDNLEGITLESDINVNNVLTLNDGKLNVGANTLGINGTISNPSGHINLSSTSNLSFGGTSAITLNDHLFDENPEFNNLTINRSGAGGVTLGDESITINGTLTLTDGTLAIAANTLTLTGNSPVRSSGNIDASHASANLVFDNAAAITLPASLFSGNVNNMTIYGAGGITAGGDFTLAGVLNLQSANPSSTKGSLDMDGNTLTMDSTATTIGQGDVSGIIKRTSIFPNTTYTMGNQYTTIYFPNVGTLPTEMSLMVTLGSAPSWRTGAIERVYDFIQTGGDSTEAVLQSHYLDSELNGNDENKLVEWMHIYGATPLTIEYGRSDYNLSENWVAVSNVNVGVYSSVFGAIEMVVDEYELQNLTWNGSTSTSWVTAANWTPQGAPSDETVITIPNASTTTFDPIIPATAICGKVIIQTGGILNSVDDGQLTVNGANGAWVNNGTFAPGTGTVIFANGEDTATVTIEGTNNFYNLTVTDKTWFQPQTDCVINIAGAFMAVNSNCILDFGTNSNTVGYNGSKTQNVIDPGDGYAYYNLALSGIGTKVLPESSVKILGDLGIDATVSTTGNTILMAGASAQNVGGATAATLNNLTIDNASGVTLTNTALTTVSGSLLINSGKTFEIAAGQKLTVSGSITNSAGSAGLILNSDATGTASVIHNTDNVAATVQRYISGDAEDWHFLSSPVFNQSISGNWLPSGTYGNGTGYDLYVWDEPTPCWVYQLNDTVAPNWPTIHPSDDFVPGRGYLYSVQASNPTKAFAGNLNNGDQTIPITYSSAVDSLKGFNLVGNPYPSSIDWKDATGWTRSDLLASGSGYDMWIWNPAAGNYGVFNSGGLAGLGTNDVTQYIAPMQGFFVRAASSGNLEMTNDVRVHNEASNWKSAMVWDKIRIRIESNAGNGYDEVLLQFGSSVNQPGAAKLFSPNKSAPSVFIPFENELLSVVHYTNTEDNPLLPLSFSAGANGEYTFSVDFNLNDFEYLILEDKETHDFYDLKENDSYHFAASTKDNANRFVLHFEPITEENGRELPARIYSNGSKVYCDFTLVDEFVDVKVVDVLGRTILQNSLNGNTIHSLQVNTPSQIVIVYAKTKNAFIVKKVFVE